MKNVMKGLFSVVLLLSITSAVAADSVGAHSYFLSGAGDVTRLPMNGTHRDSDKMYGCLNVQVEYNQNTKRADLGKYFFFGTDNTMVVGDRRNAATAFTDTQFYNLNLLLPLTYKSTVTILPKVQTVTTNIAGFVGLDEFMEGLHLTVDLPLVYTKTDMQLSQTASAGATATIADGIIDTVLVTTTNTQAGGFIQAIKGASLDGHVATAMLYGKIDGAQSKFKPGNTTIALGYDVMNKENMHLGVAVVGLVNGAGASTAEFWGEHAIGTAGRHGVGGRVNGHVRLYENDDAEINAHLNANVFGTFASTVRRSYDYTRHGNGSRYILVKEFTTAATGVYADILHYGTNISSLKAKVNAGLLYDVSAGLCYTNGNLRLDAGYQLNGHGAEKHKGWVDTITANKYGALATTTGGIAGAAGAAATATIADGATTNPDLSIVVDVAGNTGASTVAVGATTNRLSNALLNIDSGLAPSGMAHRIHGGASYNWADNEWEPALGVYGGGQIAGNNNALNGWFVGFNGSICF